MQKDGRLLFGQVPLVEIDGMLLTQSRAILSYLAAKYNLYGKDLKERLRHWIFKFSWGDKSFTVAGNDWTTFDLGACERLHKEFPDGLT